MRERDRESSVVVLAADPLLMEMEMGGDSSCCGDEWMWRWICRSGRCMEDETAVGGRWSQDGVDVVGDSVEMEMEICSGGVVAAGV